MTVASQSTEGITALVRIAASLDRIAASLEASRAGPARASAHTAKLPPAPDALAAPHTAKLADPAPTYTIDEVRRELIAATSAGTPAAVILAGLGAKRLSDVAPENYPTLVAAARAAAQGVTT